MVVDRIVREKERKQITGRSATQCWRDEKADKFPRRVRIGDNAVGWKLSELMAWVESRHVAIPNRPVAVPAEGKKRGRKPKAAVTAEAA